THHIGIASFRSSAVRRCRERESAQYAPQRSFMLDPDEPNTHTQNTIESPAQHAPRRRRAASRAAGPPSSAPDAPQIERVNDRRAQANEDALADDASAAEATARA